MKRSGKAMRRVLAVGGGIYRLHECYNERLAPHAPVPESVIEHVAFQRPGGLKLLRARSTFLLITQSVA